MTRFPRLAKLLDSALGALLVLIVGGTALAFGGSIWWAGPALAVAVSLALVAWLSRMALSGRWTMLRSPMALLGWAALGLACVQLAPLPGRLATALSSRARSAHALAMLPGIAQADDPDATLPEPVADRSPATLDRPATLRWLVGASGCLAVFVIASHFADRLGRSALIWGSVVGAFLVGTAFGVVQVLGGVSAPFGVLEAGSGRPGAPSLDDLRTSPSTTFLRPIGDSSQGVAASAAVPDRPFQFGPFVAGPGAYLALGSLALPLGLGLMLQAMAPRGSREGLAARLRDSGKGGQVALLGVSSLVGAALIGHLAGPILAVPFGLGILVVGLPTARASGLRWAAVGVSAVMLLALGLGVASGEAWGRPRGSDVLATRADLLAAEVRVKEAVKIARDFPVVGAGLGSYPTIAAYYKDRDESPGTAESSLLQWWAEAGVAGLAIAGLAAVWCVVRLPGAIRRVGSADRTLAFTLVGTLACFATFSAIHWTVELLAVAVAASAVAGTANRWLAGGTDLFVERA